MTKEEAIKIIEYTFLNADDHLKPLDFDYGGGKGIVEALRKAIEALSQPYLPSNLDEAANNYGIDIRLGYPRVMDETDRYIYNAFKAGADWMAGQGATMEITDDTEWADLDSFVHKNVTGESIIQIRKK